MQFIRVIQGFATVWFYPSVAKILVDSCCF